MCNIIDEHINITSYTVSRFRNEIQSTISTKVHLFYSKLIIVSMYKSVGIQKRCSGFSFKHFLKNNFIFYIRYIRQDHSASASENPELRLT